MTRWNIRKILLYSHNGLRKDIDLELETVNIICGGSRKGKSSITELIDYVMGAGDCHIPGVVREATSWVGLLWQRDNTFILVCRRIPLPEQVTSNDFYVDSGGSVAIPESNQYLYAATPRDAALRTFEGLLGMGEGRTEVFDAPGRQSKRVTLRSVLPYLLQDDDVIISKSNFLRGSNDERKQGIIDALPYLLGVVDESTVFKQERLRLLKRRLARIEREIEAADQIRGDESARARSLAREAESVGLIEPPDEDAGIAQLLDSLGRALTWEPGEPAMSNDSTLDSLYARERDLVTRQAEVRRRLRSAQRMVSDAAEFVHTAGRQANLLEVVKLLPHGAPLGACPVCNQEVSDPILKIEAIEHAFEQLRSDLSETERETPRINSYINQRSDEILEIQDLLRVVRSEISGIIRENEQSSRLVQEDQVRARVQGRVSLFLESQNATEVIADRENVSELQREIGRLELELDSERKIADLDDVRMRINLDATDIVKSLPFEETYTEPFIDFNPRTLGISVNTRNRKVDMRDVGSDENYLSLHFSVILALHRHFAAADRPVPGLILFDQPSRPFFPADSLQAEDVVELTDEREELARYFRALFSECERGEGLQVIVLEHAFLSDEPKFKEAVRQRWWGGTGLIPEDWPR